jgi:hypothetical protein
LDNFQVFLFAERHVIDLVAKVKCIPLHLEADNNVTVSMGRYVEVAWDSIDLERSD